MINVTKTFFPPIEEYHYYLKRIWSNEWLTNRGELVLELEEKLMKCLDVSNIILMTNGTLPLQIALKLLAKGSEVITTPFSYVATTSSIVWENCKPVFVDIDTQHLTIDETKIEDAITSSTTAILATHVFGNPCNIEQIEIIAKKYNLKVIYDAAHGFGVKYRGKSLFGFGNISTCSLHATKLFHTGEGGAIFAEDEKLRHKIFYSHNFGHNGPSKFYGLGINAKMSELQAAMGLAVLPYFEEIVSYRKKITSFYDSFLNFSKIEKLKIRNNTDWNYSYYPIIFESEQDLLEAQNRLIQKDIFPRRYFYPSLNKLEYITAIKMPVSESISKRILCLPLFVGLNFKELEEIVFLINSIYVNNRSQRIRQGVTSSSIRQGL